MGSPRAPEEIYNRPASRFVVDIVGSANLIEGCVREIGGSGAVFAAKDGGDLPLLCARSPRGDETTLALRSAYLALLPGNSVEPAPNTLNGTIERRMFHGDFVQYVVASPFGRMVVRRPRTDLFDEGADVTVSFAPERALLL